MSTQNTPVKYERPQPLLKAGSNLVVLGLERKPPEIDCYVIAAENLHALEQQRDELLTTLKEIMEWTKRYTAPNHPITVVCEKSIAKAQEVV